MTIKQILTSNIKIISPLDTGIILSFVLKKSKEFLYTYPEHELTKTQEKKFQQLIKRRAKGEPVAYLIGEKEFYGRKFKVNKNVLIPRPETELLVEETKKEIKKKRPSTSLRTRNKENIQIIADIGTGSGAIAVTLAKKVENANSRIRAQILATDSCARALKVAKENAKTYSVLSKIKFYQGNLLEPINNQKIQILVANLPYLDPKWKTKSISFEPSKALFTNEKGLKLYRLLLEQITANKFKPKIMLFEFDPRQKTDFKKLIKKLLPKAKVLFIKDLCNRDRVVKIIL